MQEAVHKSKAPTLSNLFITWGSAAVFDSCSYFVSFLLAVFPPKKINLLESNYTIPFVLRFFLSFFSEFYFSPPQRVSRGGAGGVNVLQQE